MARIHFVQPQKHDRKLTVDLRAGDILFITGRHTGGGVPWEHVAVVAEDVTRRGAKKASNDENGGVTSNRDIPPREEERTSDKKIAEDAQNDGGTNVRKVRVFEIPAAKGSDMDLFTSPWRQHPWATGEEYADLIRTRRLENRLRMPWNLGGRPGNRQQGKEMGFYVPESPYDL